MVELINEFNKCINSKDYDAANAIACQMMDITRETYNSSGEDYQKVRKQAMRDSEIEMWEKSTGYVTAPAEDRTYLDVGAGFGKDLFYANNVLNVRTYGIDNSDAFVEIMMARANDGDFAPELVIKGDMCNMSCFKDNMFDLVRSNASLLHLPVIAPRYTADLAVSEFYRVAKPNGILYLLLKYGEGLNFIDTKESMGGRLFQLYTQESIKELLTRNGFEVLFSNVERRKRLDYYIDWLNVIAIKK